MRVPDVIRHPVQNARIAPLGMGMIAIGAVCELLDVADRILGSSMPLSESVALGVLFAGDIAAGGLQVAVKKRRLTPQDTHGAVPGIAE